MTDIKHLRRIDGIEIEQDMAFQRRSWRVQRWGRTAVFLFVAAGTAGIFGGGGLSRVKQADASGVLRIDHPRFVRATAPFEVKITVDPNASGGEPLALWWDDRIAGHWEIDRMSPEPATEEIGAGRVTCRFAVSATREPVTVIIRAKTNEAGRLAGRLGVVGGPELTVKQLTYP